MWERRRQGLAVPIHGGRGLARLRRPKQEIRSRTPDVPLRSGAKREDDNKPAQRVKRASREDEKKAFLRQKQKTKSQETKGKRKVAKKKKKQR